MTSSVRKLIGARIKLHRKSKQVTQAALAEALECEVTTIGRYERGEHSPDGEQLLKLAAFFGVSPLDFLPTDADERRHTVLELRSALADLVFLIDDPTQLQRLIAEARLLIKS
jgi:transcriptional regulator with XRE-family HTH domain